MVDKVPPLKRDIERARRRASRPGKKYRHFPAAEAWLYKNKEALASVLQGLKESAEGRTSKLRSFAKYANVEID